MKRTMLAMLFGALCSTSAVADFDRGMVAYRTGDYDRAYEEFLADAALGHATSQFNLGVMYYRGESVKRDLVKAYAWIELSTQHRFDDELIKAQESLSVILSPEQIADGLAAAQRLARDHGLPFRPTVGEGQIASY